MTDESHGAPPSPPAPAPPPAAVSVPRLLLLFALFLCLTLAGAWWAAPDRAVLRTAWQHFAALPGSVHLQLGLYTLGLIAAEVLRFIAVGRALGVRVGFLAALDASIANNFFSWISPGAALGEPAAVYMLGRSGVPWDAALVIAFGKFATSFIFIFGLTGLLLALGLGPPLPPWVLVPCVTAAGVSALLMSLLVLGAYWPEASAARIERILLLLGRAPLLRGPIGRRLLAHVADTARHSLLRLSGFRAGGAPGSVTILLSHALYYAAFVGVLVTLAAAFGARAPSVIPTAVIYLAFLYVAPTPGGSGVGEASAGFFFDALLPGGRAFVVVMLFRTLTFHLHVLLGLIYLPLVGGLRELVRGSRAQPAEPAPPQPR